MLSRRGFWSFRAACFLCFQKPVSKEVMLPFPKVFGLFLWSAFSMSASVLDIGRILGLLPFSGWFIVTRFLWKSVSFHSS